MPATPLFRVAVTGDSMAPTLRPGEWWIAARTRRARVGDIVVVDHPEEELLAVKRLVRRAGRECWVEGDNAARSRDSRHFGPVDSSRIVGRLLMRYAPLPPRRPARWLTTRS